jgi:hypothetical protein
MFDSRFVMCNLTNKRIVDMGVRKKTKAGRKQRGGWMMPPRQFAALINKMVAEGEEKREKRAKKRKEKLMAKMIVGNTKFKRKISLSAGLPSMR